MNNHNAVETYPLTFASRGETVMLSEIRAGNRVRQRLAELGLTLGMEVRIVQGDLNGPVILAVKNDTRLAIGRGMAQKIVVTPLKGKL